MTKWTKEQVLLLIEQYKLYPCLHDQRNALYKNQYARNDAMVQIRDVLLPLRKETTINDIKMKYSALRSHFFVEHRKVLSSEQTEADPMNVYTPHLYFYNQMAQLVGIITNVKKEATKRCKRGSLDADSKSKSKSKYKSKPEFNFSETDSLLMIDEYNVHVYEDSQCTSLSPPREKRRRSESPQSEVPMDESILKTNGTGSQQFKTEYIDSFVNYISKKMCYITDRRKLESLMTRISEDVTNTVLEDQ